MSETQSSKTIETLHVYKGRIPSFKYLFKDGVEAIFTRDIMNIANSVYRTSNPKYIEELDHEVNTHKNAYIFIDPNEKTIQADLVDPVEAYKQKIRREVLLEIEAEQKRAALNKDMGNYKQPDFVPASSNDISAILGGDTRPEFKNVGNGDNDTKVQKNPEVTPNAATLLSVAGLNKDKNIK